MNATTTCMRTALVRVRMLRLLLTSWLKNVSWICITTAVTLVAADGEYTYAVQDNCKLVCFDSNRFGLCTIPADLGPVTANQANERRATDAASTETRRDMRKRLLAARFLAVQTLLGRLKKKKQKIGCKRMHTLMSLSILLPRARLASMQHFDAERHYVYNK